MIRRGKKVNKQQYGLTLCIQEPIPRSTASLHASTIAKPGSAVATGRADFQRDSDKAAAFNCAPARPLKTSGWIRTQITCLNTGSCHVSAVIILSFQCDRNLK